MHRVHDSIQGFNNADVPLHEPVGIELPSHSKDLAIKGCIGGKGEAMLVRIMTSSRVDLRAQAAEATTAIPYHTVLVTL